MLSTLPPAAFLSRLIGRDDRVLSAQPRVTRLFALGVARGATRELPRARGRMIVHCRRGVAWITHDGESRDVVLRANECYVVDSDQRMTAHALNVDCGLELQVDVA